MELRQLEYFVAVSKLGSFTRAAEHLYVTQPSITNAIHRLEQELHVQLFDRSQKKPLLTTEGVHFYQAIEPALLKISSALRELDDLRNLTQGTIKIAIPPIIGTYLFPGICFGFYQRYPGLKLQLYEEGSWTAREMIERGQLDIGIIIIPDNREALESRIIKKTPFVVCVAPEHPFAKRQSVSFADLAQENLITLKEDYYQYHLTLAQFKKRGLEPNIILSSGQVQTIKALVSKNIGISLLMDLVVRHDPTLVRVPLEEPITIHIGVAWKKDHCLSHAAQAFIDYVCTNPALLSGSGNE